MKHLNYTETLSRYSLLRDKCEEILDQAGPDMNLANIKCLDGDFKAKTKAVEDITAELNFLEKDLEQYKALIESRRAADAACGFDGKADLQSPLGEDSPGIKLNTKDKSFRTMFGYRKGASLNSGGFKNIDEFLNVITSGRHDERLLQLKTMTEGAPTMGGYAVPTEYSAWLMDSSLEDEIVRPLAVVYPMNSQFRKIPAWDGQDHTSNLYGGFAGVWLTEGATASKQTPLIRLLQLTAYKLGIYTSASREVVQDGITLESQLFTALQKAMGWYLDYAFLQGTGVNEPLGILTDTSHITAAREGAGAISYKDTVNMFARMHPSCLGNAVWVINQTAIPQLMTMKVATGTNSGQFVPALQNSSGKFTLHTRPVIFTEKLPALGTEGDILLVDFSQYTIGMRQEIILDVSNAPGWTEDKCDYRTIIRCDGKPTWKTYVTPKTGDTLSWCVNLETK